jgi:hypothetical protein
VAFHLGLDVAPRYLKELRRLMVRPTSIEAVMYVRVTWVLWITTICDSFSKVLDPRFQPGRNTESPIRHVLRNATNVPIVLNI